jgi:hypothetical protein
LRSARTDPLGLRPSGARGLEDTVMFKLTTLVFIIAAPTIMGLLLVLVLAMSSGGPAESRLILTAVFAGAIIAVPVSRKIAGELTRQRKDGLTT